MVKMAGDRVDVQKLSHQQMHQGTRSTELRTILCPSGMLCTAPDLRATDGARPTHHRQQQRGAGGVAAEAETSSATDSAWNTEKK